MPGSASPTTAGRLVPKCADAITIARGFGMVAAKPCRKSRAALSSIRTCGEPCETKSAGSMGGYLGFHSSPRKQGPSFARSTCLALGSRLRGNERIILFDVSMGLKPRHRLQRLRLAQTLLLDQVGEQESEVDRLLGVEP